MNFKEYQKEAMKTAVFPYMVILRPSDSNEYGDAYAGAEYTYPVLGLVGETGEIAEKIKHLIRDCNGKISNEFLKDIEKEIGDVQWYLAVFCEMLHLDLEEVAIKNIEKLRSRQERGKLLGKGDNR